MRGEPQEAAATLRQALALWRGPALADVSQERFAQPEIARLEDLRLACLGDRVDADLACGRHAEIAGELEGLVRQHPLRERLRGQQMLALYRAGRQADALDAYRAAYAALVDGLGIEPSPRAASAGGGDPAPRRPGSRAGAAQRAASAAPDARRLVTCVLARLALETANPIPSRCAPGSSATTTRPRAICARHGGTVAELRSDAVLAVFGIAVAHEDDALRALRAAIELGARTGDAVRLAPLRCLHGRRSLGAGTDRVDRRGGHRSRAPRPVGRGRRDPHGRVDVAARPPRAPDASALPDGGFLLRRIDADAPAIRRRLDRPLVGRERGGRAPARDVRARRRPSGHRSC